MPNFSVYQTKTTTSKGGTALYVLNSLVHTERADLNQQVHGALESTFVEIEQSKKKNIVCGSIYRHPSSNVEDFIMYMVKILDKLAKEDKILLLMGDFNLNLLNYQSNTEASNLYDSISSFMLQPLILQPTRVSEKSQTLIDNIFSNNCQYDSVSGNLVSKISDHFPQFSIFQNFFTSKKYIPNKYGRSFRNFDNNAFLEVLNKINWKNVFGTTTCPNLLMDLFLNTLNEVLDLMAPIKLLTKKEINSNSKPWITKGILTSMKVRDKIYKKFLSGKSPDTKNFHLNKYKQYRNLIVTLIRVSKKNHYQYFFEQNKTNIKNTWNGVKELISLNKKQKFTPHKLILDNKRTAKTPKSIAEAFNDYFASIGKSLDQKIPNSKKPFSDYLCKPKSCSMFLRPTLDTEISDLIKNLNSNKTCGPNSFLTHLLKVGKHLLSTPLSFIINKSFETGVVPSSLKLARVVPLFKSGAQDKCGNYRPISLLSNLSKVFERAMYNRLYSYLETMKIISPLQFGFRKMHSTNHALVSIIEHVKSIVDHGNFACGLFLDFQKAFDTVNINILLEKMINYGIRGPAINWFKSYLQGRSQFVTVDNETSSSLSLTCGVPQGSILGPLLFLIYINDFQNCIKNNKAFHFADDTNVIFSKPNIGQLRKALNKQISIIFDWLCANRLSLNAKKTELMLFHSTHKQITFRLTVKIKGTKVFLSHFVKYLGILIDSKLSWKKHISELTKKLNRATALLAKLRNYVHEKSLKSLYFSLFQSHINYGCLVWGFAKQSLINKIFRIQKRAIRIITCSSYKCNTSPLFHKLGILKIHDHIELCRYEFVHDWIHGRLPTTFDSTFSKTNSGQYSLRRSNEKVAIPFRKLDKWGTDTLRYKGALIHNIIIDLGLHKVKSKRIFKNKLKSMYLVNYV